MRRIFLFFLISIISTHFLACHTAIENTERLDALMERMEELDGSSALYPDVDELTGIRQEVVELLLEEGETQMRFVGVPGHETALESARDYFEMVVAISEREFSFTEETLRQQWDMMSWAWGADVRRDWRELKYQFPGLWPYTVGELVTCFVGDLIGGWDTESNRITLPPLPAHYAERAREHLTQLENLSIEELQANAEANYNFRVQMTYVIRENSQFEGAYEAAVHRYQQIPGANEDGDRYQDIWNEMVSQINASQIDDDFAYMGPTDVTVERLDGSGVQDGSNTLRIRVVALGYLPYSFVDDIAAEFSQDSPEGDRLTIVFETYNPGDSR